MREEMGVVQLLRQIGNRIADLLGPAARLGNSAAAEARQRPCEWTRERRRSAIVWIRRRRESDFHTRRNATVPSEDRPFHGAGVDGAVPAAELAGSRISPAGRGNDEPDLRFKDWQELAAVLSASLGCDRPPLAGQVHDGTRALSADRQRTAPANACHEVEDRR